MVAKFLDDRIHLWFHCPGHIIMAHNGSLESDVLDIVGLAELVVGDFSVDGGAAVLVEVGLAAKSISN